MDIEIIIKKTAFYSILTALLTGLFVALIVVSQQLLSGITGYTSFIATVIGSFIIALLFQPIRELVQQGVDKVFFRARYNYQTILSRYSQMLKKPMPNLDRFSKVVSFLLRKSMALSSASILIFDRQEHEYVVRAVNGKGEELAGLSLHEDSPLIREIYARGRELDREEIKAEKKEDVLKEMDRLKASLIIPSITTTKYFKKPTLISTINLGKKLSDESYSQEDISFLKIMAAHAALSIEHAFIMEELVKNQEQVIKSEKLAALGTITAGIAHELNNPLAYMFTLSQTMGQNWDDPAWKENLLKFLPAEIERMKLIIDSISDYSKPQPLKIEPVSLEEIINKTLTLVGFEIKKRGVEVKKEYPENPLAMGDKHRLVQVFLNLINNALQAMVSVPEGERTLTLSITRGENEIRAAVKDSGPGIPFENRKKLFDLFFTTKETGTGLGLSITKEIIDKHHGALLIDSIPGKGATFTVCLPRA